MGSPTTSGAAPAGGCHKCGVRPHRWHLPENRYHQRRGVGCPVDATVRALAAGRVWVST